MGADDLLPPRKRNWTRGKFQIGVFVRTPAGSTIQMVTDRPTVDMVKSAIKLIGGRPALVEASECFPKERRK